MSLKTIRKINNNAKPLNKPKPPKDEGKGKSSGGGYKYPGLYLRQAKVNKYGDRVVTDKGKSRFKEAEENGLISSDFSDACQRAKITMVKAD